MTVRFGMFVPQGWKMELVGTPEQVCEKIARYVEMGCTYFVPWSPDYPSTGTLQLFADKVMPEFR